jgi:plasmid stabilization system protein ParE
MILVIDPEAEIETLKASQWYERERRGLGVEFLAAVDAALQKVKRAPEQGTRLETLLDEPMVRRFLMPRFPYAIIYHTSPDSVRVLAVTHVRRKPNYWKRRLRR